MPKKTSGGTQKRALRQKAEKLYSERPEKKLPRDPASLVHELEVHQIELEMQNKELQKARLEAEDSRNRYLDLYDFAPVGYLTLDEKGVISELNLTAARLLGIERASLIGKSLHHFIESGFQDVFYLHSQRVLESSETKACELVLKKKDGTSLHAQLDSIGMTTNGRKKMRTILTDITERKRAEEKMRESEERFRIAQEMSPDGFTVLRPVRDDLGQVVDFTWVYENATIARVNGTDPQAVVGKRLLDLFPGHAGSLFLEVYKQVAETGQSRIFEEPYQGETMTELTWFRIVVVSMGKDIAILAQDITEQKRANEALRLSEDKFVTAFANNAAGIAISRLEDGAVLEVNDTWVALTGYSREDVLGRSARYMWPMTEASARFVSELRENGYVRGWEQQFIKKSGEVYTVQLWAQILTLQGESVILSTLVDITDRKKAEEALKKAYDSLELRVEERTAELSQAYEELSHEMNERKKVEEQLRQSQKMEAIGTLAGGIAHDFNNILGATLGFTEMALEDVADRPDVERNLQHVLKSAMRAKDLVKQILAFSRKTNYERAPLSLSTLIKETVQLLKASIPSTIEIKLDIITSWDRILAAPVEVQQILMNLATNASLAMQEKGGVLEISLSDIAFTPESPVLGSDVMQGEYIQLAVKDTGIGMTPDVMKRVFEPFFTTREVDKGTGMGLAVVYGIVKSLQGAITVESTPGVGSTFRVFLPKIQAEALGEEAVTIKASGGTERILFIDDEELIVEWGKATLERLGYRVTAVNNSKEALNIFSSDPSRFDLVITDYTMPGATGVQFAKELLKIKPDVRIILCTGHSETISPDIARQAGIMEYLTKPLAKLELAQAVRRVLDKKQNLH